jgi:hypothetical protein
MSGIDKLSPLNVTHYEPGVCNIGPAEIARRRNFGHISLVVTLAVFAVLVATQMHLLRLFLILPAAGAATGYLQAYFHFCAGFGSAGVYNFGELGQEVRIEDPAALKRDRVKSTQIFFASVAIGIVVAVVAVLLPF